MNRVPHLRRGFIAARVGYRAQLDRFSSNQQRCHPERSLARPRQTKSKDLRLLVLCRHSGAARISVLAFVLFVIPQRSEGICFCLSFVILSAAKNPRICSLLVILGRRLRISVVATSVCHSAAHPGSPTSVLARWGGKGICFCSLRCHPERSLARQRQTQSKDLLLSVLRRERGV